MAEASFNPYSVLDSNDPGDVIGKATSKKGAASANQKPAAGPWAPASKAMAASTPAKKKKSEKKPASAATNKNQQANGKGSKNGANGGAKARK
ncbi:hypothetical protein HU200_031696 [Digitaria exilis]|uniref:Uncharacterized protein n=1 Tax=Digitaria exilis TaxID=1010633 RepID=A0A835BPQ9_9POAL|nr:hypothetical protein HU200_031696 [Digitaria exilis]